MAEQPDSTDATVSLLRSNAIALLSLARQRLLGMLEDLSDDHYTFQPCPGANHLAWILGHLAVVDDNFLALLSGEETQLPQTYRDLFARGTSPLAERDLYPKAVELLEHCNQRRAGLLNYFQELPLEQLILPPPEPLTYFAPNRIGMVEILAWHEGMHTGQVTVIRKALGLKPRFR